MIGLFCFVLAVLASPFKSKLRLEAENAALRHQLNVLRRRLRGRVRLTNHDRWFLILLYRWFPSILQVLAIIRPDTLLRWHRGRLSLLSRSLFPAACFRELICHPFCGRGVRLDDRQRIANLRSLIAHDHRPILDRLPSRIRFATGTPFTAAGNSCTLLGSCRGHASK